MDNLMTPSRMPRTSLEWKRALAEVKLDYLNRRYRSCSTRCCDLLTSAKTSVRRRPWALAKKHPD